MREYSKISVSLWHSEKFVKLSDQGKLLYLYLHSCPHINSTGCFYLPKGYLMADLGWEDRAMDRAIEELSIELIQWNFDKNIVLIKRFLEHSPITNKKHGMGAVNRISLLPDCPEKTIIINQLKNDKHCKDIKELRAMDRAIDRSMDTTYTLTNTIIEKDITKVISKKTAEKKPVKIPEKKGKPHAKPKRNTSIKTEFGEDQRMPEKYRPVAAEKGLHESWHNFEWGLFCDYWLGKGEGRVDWTATWRGWSARAVNWDERKGSDKNTPSDRASGSATLDAVNELMARRSDQKRQSLRDGEAGF